MAFELGPLPVFIRVGAGAEFEVGTFAPDVALEGSVATVGWKPALAALLRGIADEVEAD